MQERDILSNQLSTNVRVSDFADFAKTLYVDSIRLKIKLLGIFSTDYAARYAFKVFCTPNFSRKTNEEIENVFNQANKNTHLIDDHQIQTYVFGAENKKTILLVHGWEGQARDFFKMIPILVDQGFRVITLDGPAHGRSSGKQTNLIAFVSVLKMITQIYGNSYHAIMGHSFGGAAVIKLLSDYPELQVNNTITISSPNKILNIFKGYANFMNFNDKILNKLITNIKDLYGEDIDKLNVEDLYKNIQSKKLLIHDFSDSSICYSIAEEILSQNNDIAHIQTNTYGHLHILKVPNVLSKIIYFLEQSGSETN